MPIPISNAELRQAIEDALAEYVPPTLPLTPRVPSPTCPDSPLWSGEAWLQRVEAKCGPLCQEARRLASWPWAGEEEDE